MVDIIEFDLLLMNQYESQDSNNLVNNTNYLWHISHPVDYFVPMAFSDYLSYEAVCEFERSVKFLGSAWLKKQLPSRDEVISDALSHLL